MRWLFDAQRIMLKPEHVMKGTQAVIEWNLREGIYIVKTNDISIQCHQIWPFSVPFLSSPSGLQGQFENTWCRCQAVDPELSISLSNGVTPGLCWPLNSLRWRRRPPAAALVWHSLLAACLFSAGRSHFRVKSWVWQRGTFNAEDWSICREFVYTHPWIYCSSAFHPGCGPRVQRSSPPAAPAPFLFFLMSGCLFFSRLKL